MWWALLRTRGLGQLLDFGFFFRERYRLTEYEGTAGRLAGVHEMLWPARFTRRGIARQEQLEIFSANMNPYVHAPVTFITD